MNFSPRAKGRKGRREKEKCEAKKEIKKERVDWLT